MRAKLKEAAWRSETFRAMPIVLPVGCLLLLVEQMGERANGMRGADW